MKKRERDPTKASRLEVLGAWLHVWVPPRDVVIPPVPWGKVAALFGGLVVAGVLVAVFVAPAIDEGKQKRSAQEQRELDRRAAIRRELRLREQRPRFGRADGDRATVVAAVEVRIGADARKRFDPDARPADCEPAPGVDEAQQRVTYDCHSAIRDIVGAGDQDGATGVLAIPYRAVVDFDRGTYAFCKANPSPGEQAIPDPRKIIDLPRACKIPT